MLLSVAVVIFTHASEVVEKVQVDAGMAVVVVRALHQAELRAVRVETAPDTLHSEGAAEAHEPHKRPL